MSRHETVPLACPKCGRESPFTVWSSLNVTIDPQEKPRLRAGELTRFTCPHCGESADVVTPLLYHDMQQQAMIYFLPGGGDGEAVGALRDFEGMGIGRSTAGRTFRRVTSRNALLEKISIVDGKLDDVSIEYLKLMLPEQLPADVRPLVGEIRFDGLTREAEGEQLAFVVLLTDGRSAGLTVGREVYDRIDAETKPTWRRPTGPWPLVDETTIASFVFGDPSPVPTTPVDPPAARRGFFGRLFGRG